MPAARKAAKKRVRKAPRYHKGDDLTKTAGDRKRGGGKYESWESRKSQ